MRYILPNQRVVQGDNPFEYEGVQYPAGWLRETASREQLGAVEIVEEPMPDTRLGFANEDPENPGKWIYTPFDAERRRQTLMTYAAQKRWAKELSIADERTQNILIASWISAKLNPDFTINWKVDQNNYVELDANTIITKAEEVRAAIQSCFDLNKNIDELIVSDQINTHEQIDEMFA